MNRPSKMSCVVVALLGVALLAPPAAHAAKNVIVMVPDGCSQTVQTAARWYKGEPLVIDSLVSGMMSTYMANSVITGSAASATAFASGHKTTARFIGLGPRPEDLLTTEEVQEEYLYKPLATVLEAAKLQGKGTGLIATSRISHATPASYAAHIQDRGWDNEIMEHMVYNEIDVVFGGGSRHLKLPEHGGRRTDGEDLFRELVVNMGYQWVDDATGLAALSSGKVWGLFSSSHMQAHIDRQWLAPDEPSIAEMTAKAIELLSHEYAEEGFFLMIEGSQVDWAGHNNDPIYMITDFLAFDEAVEVALDFAQQDGDTLLLIFPDHNTGGFNIGNYSTSWAYTGVTVEQLLDPLSGMKATSNVIGGLISDDPSPENIKAQVLEYWGLEITNDDANQIIALIDAGLWEPEAVSEVISANYTVFGWTSHGHTGEDVPIWSYGPDRPVGLFDNTDMAHIVADALGTDLAVVDSLLYQDIATVYPNYEVDTTDAENPVLVAGSCRLPISKCVLEYAPRDMDFNVRGLVVQVPETGKIFVPFTASALIHSLNSVAVKTMSDHQVRATAEAKIAEVVESALSVQ
jgi:alkaline phosphatase